MNRNLSENNFDVASINVDSDTALADPSERQRWQRLMAIVRLHSIDKWQLEEISKKCEFSRRRHENNKCFPFQFHVIYFHCLRNFSCCHCYFFQFSNGFYGKRAERNYQLSIVTTIMSGSNMSICCYACDVLNSSSSSFSSFFAKHTHCFCSESVRKIWFFFCISISVLNAWNEIPWNHYLPFLFERAYWFDDCLSFCTFVWTTSHFQSMESTKK